MNKFEVGDQVVRVDGFDLFKDRGIFTVTNIRPSGGLVLDRAPIAGEQCEAWMAEYFALVKPATFRVGDKVRRIKALKSFVDRSVFTVEGVLPRDILLDRHPKDGEWYSGYESACFELVERPGTPLYKPEDDGGEAHAKSIDIEPLKEPKPLRKKIKRTINDDTMEATILNHLRAVGNISPSEAATLYRCRSLSKRISTLKSWGYLIQTEIKADRTGQRYARYTLLGKLV